MEPIENKKLIYLNSLRDSLFENFLKNKLHHSLMFLGNKGVGKATLCYHLANKILNENTTLKSNESFLFDTVLGGDLDDNNPTFNLIKSRKHPDLLVIEKEFDKKTSKIDREIKIASARKISDFINLSPFVSTNKVIIIDSIDEMNFAAQNAILKAVEEPKTNTYIFLICHNINNVLDTIKSRCQIQNIPSPDFISWQKIMHHISSQEYKKLKNDELKDIYSLSNGSINFAFNIMNNEGMYLKNTIESILSSSDIDVENVHILGDKINTNEDIYELFFYFLNLTLYNSLVYFSTGKSSDDFIKKNSKFILKNNQESIAEHIKTINKIYLNTRIYNLGKKHAIVVLFNKLTKN